MDHIHFSYYPTNRVLLLIKSSHFNKEILEKFYINPLNKVGVNKAHITAMDLLYTEGKPPASKQMKEYLTNILKVVDTLKSQYLFVADAPYFKKLTAKTKTKATVGYVLNCVFKGYEHIKVIYCPHHNSALYDENQYDLMKMAFETLSDALDNRYVPLGQSIIHSETYPKSFSDIQKQLQKLHQYPTLTCDIETYSLSFYQAAIATIGFAWDKHNGTAFICDGIEAHLNDISDMTLVKHESPTRRYLLREFFENYQGKLVFHNASFDIKVLVYSLWMEDRLNNYEGMLKGIEVLTKNFDDTKIITYLCTNNCLQNNLSLKDQSHEFAGNYAESDIDNIQRIPIHRLLRYNLVDCLSTHYVFNKHNLDEHNQRQVYEDLYKPAIRQIIQMELVGMPVDMKQVCKVKAALNNIKDRHTDSLKDNPLIKSFIKFYKLKQIMIDNAKLKKKERTLEDPIIERIVFDPNSTSQLKNLLYAYFELPVLDLTGKGFPSTAKDTLNKLIHKANEEQKKVIQNLIELNKVNKIINTFIPVLEAAIPITGYDYRIFGNFNLGGTKCVTGDTEFTTTRGLIRATHLKEGDKVLTHTGQYYPITKIYNIGLKTAYRIHTEKGRTLTTTGNHPYYVEGNWVNADKLSIGTPLTTFGIAKEEWKQLPEFPMYTVSNTGKIRNDKTGRLLVQQPMGNYGHLKVTLPKISGGKRKENTKKDKSVHRLVAETFLGACPEGKQVAHINGIAWDNRITNLTYKTSKENSEDMVKHGTADKTNSSKAKLTWEKIHFIRNTAQDLGMNNAEISRLLNVSRELIKDVVNNKRWLLQTTINKEIEFEKDTIVKIEKLTPRLMYGFTIANDHSHCTNGIITHNSSRLSSSKPNLQQLPSGSTYGDLIKSCFKPNPSLILCGADFTALEDIANALVTRDPAKLECWEQGFDGHCYRMVRYWPDQFTHVDLTNPDEVNQLKKTHSDLRTASKAPSFSMQYGGGIPTLVNNSGFTEEEAKQIYNNYHELYKVSDEYVEAKLDEAIETGYVTLAYGTKLRTPVSASTIKGDAMPREAYDERKTAGNALFQSYGFITTRAAIELQERANQSEYRGSIHICATIHDAIYCIVPNRVGAVKWLNDNLIACMLNHQLPELDWHDTVKISAEMEVYYPSWKDKFTLKNNATLEEIFTDCHEK